MNHENKDLSVLGCIIAAIAFFIFPLLAYEVFGFFGIFVGAIVSACACRPAEEGGPWIWEKPVKEVEK